MQSTFMRDFDKLYDAAMPSTGYAILQMSPRKWLVLKIGKERGVQEGIQVPAQAEIIATCANRWNATAEVKHQVYMDLEQTLAKKGTAFLDTLTDDQLAQLPLGPIVATNLGGYMRKRLNMDKWGDK